jgi:hypothetical protein
MIRSTRAMMAAYVGRSKHAPLPGVRLNSVDGLLVKAGSPDPSPADGHAVALGTNRDGAGNLVGRRVDPRSRRAWRRSRSRCAAGRRGTVGMMPILTRSAAQLDHAPQPDTKPLLTT